MKIVLLPLLMLTPAASLDDAATETVVLNDPEISPTAMDGEICHDRIFQAREASGNPQLDRSTASPDEPLFIAAVDHRLDGCSVLMMRNDTSDIRPIPVPDEDGAKLTPAG